VACQQGCPHVGVEDRCHILMITAGQETSDIAE
jgi:hypothetical protein